MSDSTNKTIPERIQPWLTLLYSLGITAGGAATVIATLWQAAKGSVELDGRLLLALLVGLLSIIALAVWWIVKLHKKTRLFVSSEAATFRVSDEFVFVPKLGFWIEKKTGLRICAHCIMPPKKTVSPLFEGFGLDLRGNTTIVWRCGQCGAEYWHETGEHP